MKIDDLIVHQLFHSVTVHTIDLKNIANMKEIKHN